MWYEIGINLIFLCFCKVWRQRKIICLKCLCWRFRKNLKYKYHRLCKPCTQTKSFSHVMFHFAANFILKVSILPVPQNTLYFTKCIQQQKNHKIIFLCLLNDSKHFLTQYCTKMLQPFDFKHISIYSISKLPAHNIF